MRESLDKWFICFTKPTKIDNTKASSAIIILNKQLKGFEADYLTKKNFRLQVKQKKIWGIVEFIIDLVASLFNDSYGKYDEDTYTSEGPYFLFDRGKGSATLGFQLEILRAKITGLDKNNEPVIKDNFDKIFEQILDDAENSASNCDKATVCEGSSVAKSAAFVYVVGIKKDISGNLVRFDMSNSSDIALRNSYRDKALNYLHNLSGYHLDNGLDMFMDVANFFAGPIGATLVVPLQLWNAVERENMQFRSKELLMIVQTLDMLEWAHKIDAQLSPVGVGYEKKHIKEKYVVPMHRRCQLPITGNYDAHNNFTLMPAAALGAAAIALKDEGDKFTKTYKHPGRWANAALYNIHNTMWYDGLFFDAMSQPGGLSGFSEGPHYFRYSFENLLPFFRARYNLKPADFCNTYYSSLINPFGKYVQNNFYDENYDNLYKWFNNITMSSGQSVPYDDSWANTYFNGVLAIRGNFNHMHQLHWVKNYDIMGLQGTTGLNLWADYLAAINPPNGVEKHTVSNMPNEIVLSHNSNINEYEKHFLHLNTKTKEAISSWHEHGDVGSFTIGAGEDFLAIDPAFYGENDKAEVHDGKYHNTILIDGEGPDEEDYAIWKDVSPYGDMAKVKFIYWNYNLGARTSAKANIEREISFINEKTAPYYVIEDIIENKNWFNNQTVEFSINGNGSNANGEESFKQHPDASKYPNTYIWDHPCRKDDYNGDNFGMQVTFSSVYYGSIYSNVNNTYKHGNSNQVFNPNISVNGANKSNALTLGGNITKNIATGSQEPHGNHNTLSTSVDVAAGDKGHIKTSVQIIPCAQIDVINPPQFRITPRYTSHLFEIDEQDTSFNYHYSRIEQAPTIDTAMNPLAINPLAVFATDARSVFFKYSTDREFKTGNCYTFTNFRKARIETGKELSYNDTTYILSTKYASAYYSLEGKYKYKGYVQTDTACDVKLYLADVDTNFAMAAMGISYNYNDSTHIMTLHAPVGNTNFTIELADPCLMSCFFPYTTDSIKNTFDFATGTKETLPHKLTITTPNGYLKIRNGSHMQICSGKWLRNKDSLIVDYRCPEDGDPGKGFVVCPDVANRLNLTNPPPTLTQLYPSTDDYTPSQITVNSYAALILDSGSYTRFGNNTKLNIKPYASFIIRKNAKLDIGDAKSCGHAEIICEPNSYVHFEDSADIKFWQMKDTNDIHLFYISLKPQATAAHAGIEPSMLDMLQNTDVIIDTAIAHAEPICEVAKIRADYGINNRDWGFGNFIKPKAWAYIANDTLCPDECLYINYDRMLNDVRRGITICLIDTTVDNKVIYTGCYSPALPGGNVGMNSSTGDGCDSIKNSKPLSDCDPNAQIPGKWYRIFLSSYNDCDQLDTMKLYFIRMPRISPDFTMADTGCTGIGSVSADENNDWNSIHYRDITKWHVHVIDSAAPNYLLQSVQYGGDWEYAKGTFPLTFTFPNFNWIGGFRYAVSHTIGTRGCKDTTMWDTIMIVPGAHIKAVKPTLFENRIADVHEVQLNGMVKNASSFAWSPSIGLDRTDTLSVLCTTTENKTYTLSAYFGSCVAKDSVSIRYNTYSYLGNNDTMCMAGNSVLLGNRYNAPMFLGWIGRSSLFNLQDKLANIFNDAYYVDRPDSNYLRYFNAFMYTSDFKNELQHIGSFPVYDLFTSDSLYNWEQVMHHPNFKTYYLDYLSDINRPFYGVTHFNAFLESSELSEPFQMNPIESSAEELVDNMLNAYATYYAGVYDNDTAYTPPLVYWYKVQGNDTTEVTEWQNQYLVIDTPTITTTYIQQVFHPDNSSVEYDTRTVFVDTATVAMFYPSMQWDSSAYFTNATSPSSSTNTYLWDFGDGSSTSTDVNPFHTFPSFNTYYIVCLTVTNTCGSPSYCDTVWVDSLHIGGSFKVTNNRHSEHSEESKNVSYLSKTNATTNNCQLSNYPNPFDQSTIIDYEIWQTYSMAELRITNVLGQEVFSQKLNRPMDKVQIDGSALHDGLYYYSLIVDGAVKLTKTMSVIR